MHASGPFPWIVPWYGHESLLCKTVDHLHSQWLSLSYYSQRYVRVCSWLCSTQEEKALLLVGCHLLVLLCRTLPVHLPTLFCVFSRMNLYQFMIHLEMPMASMAFSAESKFIRSKAPLQSRLTARHIWPKLVAFSMASAKVLSAVSAVHCTVVVIYGSSTYYLSQKVSSSLF